jgi:diguanylate cyclase (GGDEF)-like protein
VALFVAGVITRAPFVLGTVAYLGMALGWQRWVECTPSPARRRRLAALGMDQMMIAMLVWLGGTDCVIFLWTGPLASIGHGIRYGQRAGFQSALLGGVALSLATLSSPEWRAMPMLSAGIVLMAVLMPIHVVLLAKYLSRAREGAEARAMELERQTRIDPLTGLLNRVGLQAVLDELRIHDPDYPMALAFVDLDGFKTVNDALGHAAGDLVLCQVADHMRSAVGPDDHVVRLGGDEFAVLHTGPQDPITLERLGKDLCEAVRRVHPRQRPDLCVHASIGICSGYAADPIDELLQKADTLMYQSKRRGRDGFVLGHAGLVESDTGALRAVA